MNDIKKQIEDLRNILIQIVDEVKKSAKREDVRTLKKYINLWEPIKFVTYDKVEQIVREILEEKKG